MADPTAADAFLAKAELSLAGAESEFANGRYDNTVNRAYYACFQAAIAALLHAGIGPSARTGRWRHEFVQASFAGDLVNRRRLYPSALRSVLSDNMTLRQQADSDPQSVSEVAAAVAVNRSRRFLAVVGAEGAEP